MKVLKKHEVAKLEFRQTRTHGEAKYDWATILGGQSVEMTAGEDYQTDPDKEKAETKLANFLMRIRDQARKENKKVEIKRLASGTGIVVTASTMTPAEIEQAAKDSVERKAKLAASKAKKAAEGNGQPHVEAAESTPLE